MLMKRGKVWRHCAKESMDAWSDRNLPLAATHRLGNRDSGFIMAVSDHRDAAYLRDHLAGGIDLNPGPAADGSDLSRGASLEAGAAVSALGLFRLHCSGCHRHPDVRLRGGEDVWQLGIPDQAA